MECRAFWIKGATCWVVTTVDPEVEMKESFSELTESSVDTYKIPPSFLHRRYWTINSIDIYKNKDVQRITGVLGVLYG